MKNNYSELINKAIAELKENDDLFISCIDELDSWNGFADGFRCWEMWELNEIFYDCKVTDFLDKLGRNFNHNDEYFYDSIYGIESTDSKVDLYRDNVDEGELLDNLIDRYSDLDISWIDSDFDNLLQEIIEAKENA